jgi:AraC-like DNA-binding protein
MSRDDRNLNASLAQSSTNRYNNSHERIIRETFMSLTYLSRSADNFGGRKISGYLDQVRLQRKRLDLKFRDIHDSPPKRN